MGWPEISDAIAAAITAASGLPVGSVIWSAQNAGAPAPPYIDLALGAVSDVGQDDLEPTILPDWRSLTPYTVGARVLNDTGIKTYECTTAGTSGNAGGPTGTGGAIADGSVVWKFIPAGQEIALNVIGIREVVLEVQAFTPGTTDASTASPAGPTARALLERVRTALRLPSVRDLLRAVGVAPFDTQAATYVPDVPAVGFRGRGTMSIRLRIPPTPLADLVGFIATVQGTLTTTGGGAGSDTEPFGVA